MRKKLKSKRGETLTEVLVSILVVAISAAMLATMVSSSTSLSHRAVEETEKLYEELSSAEARDGIPDTKTVRINGVEIGANYFSSGDDTLTSFERAVEGG